MSGETVFFEPWSLGDVLIAAAIYQHTTKDAVLACHARWHPLLKEVFSDSTIKLIPVELAYTMRSKNSIQLPFNPIPEIKRVLSIRGDIRDFMAAKKLFPNAKICMSGWIPFLARRLSLVDFPFRYQMLSVENRYKAWAKIAGVDFKKVELGYLQKQKECVGSNKVFIHIGAQWASKQYPYVFELKQSLIQNGFEVEILGGHADKLPSKILESEIIRSQDTDLVHRLRSAPFVITNDSGPMHLAALLGCRTIVVAHLSNIMEWLPPLAKAVMSPQMPKGYMPNKGYCSDKQIPGWPSVDEVVTALANYK